MSAYDSVIKSRAQGRPTAKKFIENIFTDFFELHGDRLFADDAAVVGGIAKLDGEFVTVIAIEKGEDTKTKIKHNFGAPNPEGYRKALRLMKQAEKFKRPVICFVDTSGAYCGIGAEERGQGSAIATNLMEMMMLQPPIISVVIGEGGSGGAIGLAVANEVWMMENAYYSVISPEGAASIIWKDASKVEQAAEALKFTAADLKNFGVIEEIFMENNGQDFSDVYSQMKKELIEKIAYYDSLSGEELARRRYDRFRKIGRTQQ